MTCAVGSGEWIYEYQKLKSHDPCGPQFHKRLMIDDCHPFVSLVPPASRILAIFRPHSSPDSQNSSARHLWSSPSSHTRCLSHMPAFRPVLLSRTLDDRFRPERGEPHGGLVQSVWSNWRDSGEVISRRLHRRSHSGMSDVIQHSSATFDKLGLEIFISPHHVNDTLC